MVGSHYYSHRHREERGTHLYTLLQVCVHPTPALLFRTQTLEVGHNCVNVIKGWRRRNCAGSLGLLYAPL
jgi:hypothetical protein